MKNPTCTVLSRARTNMNLLPFQKCPSVVCVLLLVLFTLIPHLIVNVQCQNSSSNANAAVGHFIKSRDTARNSNAVRNKNNQNKSSFNAVGTNSRSCIIESSSSDNKNNSSLSGNKYGFRSTLPYGSNSDITRRSTKKKNNDPVLSHLPSIQEEPALNCSSIGDDKKEKKRKKRKNRNPDNKKRRGQNRRNNGKDTTTSADSEPRRLRHADMSKLSLWIDEQQVKLFSGFSLEIHVITDGLVLPYILDKNFEQYLPIIPGDVGVVNFTWRAGDRKYFYHFDRLNSFNEDILLSPIVSIDTRGRIPRKPKVFSVFLPCTGTKSGVASFTVGLLIETKRGPLMGTPIRLRLRKECAERKPESDPECDRKCANGGYCNNARVCRCPEGYMGPYCLQALCYPQCMNGGVCTSPGVCSCPTGFHGVFCEGGICGEKCLNGGKCIQKDTCECTKGFYGKTCEYSKCMIPCLNGGKCKGVNLCRCPPNFSGDHCEIGLANRTITQRHSCSLPCRHGTCVGKNQCECYDGFFGRRCQRRSLR